MNKQHDPDQQGADAVGSSAIVRRVAREPGGLILSEPAASGRHGGDGSAAARPAGMPSLLALLRFKWLIAGVFLVISAVSIPAIWLLITPEYSAQAVLRVSPVTTRILYGTEESGVVPLYDAFVNTQVSIIKSPAVLQRVLETPAVQATEWYKERPRSLRTMLGGSPPTDIERLREALSVRSLRDTQLIDVSMSASTAASAALIVDVVADAYKQLVDETHQLTGTQRYDALTTQASTLQKEIEGLQATKINISKRLGTTGPEELRSRLATQLSDLEAERQTLERKYGLAQWQLQRFPAPEAETDEPAAPGVYGPEEEDGDRQFWADTEWRDLRGAVEAARHSLQLAQQNLGSAHPRILALESDVEYAERQMRVREEQLRAMPPDALGRGGATDGVGDAVMGREALQYSLERMSRELELLGEDIKNHRAKMAEAGDIAQDIAQYDEDIKSKREIHESVQARLQVLEMESKAPARITVASHAIQSSRPTSDRRILLSIMAMVGAGMTGCAAAYVRTVTDQKIVEADDVQTSVNVPFLGHFPPLTPADAELTNCSPLVRECTRMVRTALLERLKSTDDRVTLITSSSSQVGKTTVAILLATSLARLGKRTLLVDADLRNPSVASRMGMAMGGGLAALLSESARDASVILPSSVAKLDVLPAGDRHQGFDPELLANGVFSACLKRWKKNYDYIVLDSPPVLPVADARILAGQADGTLMVLRSSYCRRSEVMQTYADLAAAGGRLLGTVLVGARSGSGHRRGYGYGYGYGHGYGYELGGEKVGSAGTPLPVGDKCPTNGD